jgi:hypothetical protein
LHLQIAAAAHQTAFILAPPSWRGLQKVLETVELVPGKLTKEIVEYGAGEAKPARGQTVTAHYDGRLTSGAQFDASRKRGKPFNFRVGIGQVISGWDVGMASMVRHRSTKCHAPRPRARALRCGCGGPYTRRGDCCCLLWLPPLLTRPRVPMPLRCRAVQKKGEKAILTCAPDYAYG